MGSDTQPTVPMYTPTGQFAMVPHDKVDDAIKHFGGRVAVKMFDPSGTPRFVPLDKYAEVAGKYQDATGEPPVPADVEQAKDKGGFEAFYDYTLAAIPALYHAFVNPASTPEEKTASSILSRPGVILDRLVIQPARQQIEKAKQTTGMERAGHILGAAIPGVGPFAAQLGEDVGKEAGAGNYAAAAGSVLGTAATFGASDVLPRAIRATPKATRFLAQELTGMRPKVIAEDVAKVIKGNEDEVAKAKEENAENRAAFEKSLAQAERKRTLDQADADAKAAKENAEAATKHLHDLQSAISEKTAKEDLAALETKIRQAKVDADHADAVAKVQENNRRIIAKHAKIAERVNEENRGVEQSLDVIRKKQEELYHATRDYYALEDATKAEAKEKMNKAWKPWNEKIEDMKIASGGIARELSSGSDQMKQELRQLKPSTDDVPPESNYAKLRDQTARSNFGADYDALPLFKKEAVDKALKSAGHEPEPLDFNPEEEGWIPVRKVQRAKSILGLRIASGKYQGYLLGEMKQLYSKLTSAVQDASEAAGALDDYENANEVSSKYFEAFGRKRPSPSIGDKIRKKTANPEEYRAEEEKKLLEAAGVHSQELIEAHNRVRKLRKEVKNLPNEEQIRKRLKQPPAPPTIDDWRPGYRLQRPPIHPGPVPAVLSPGTEFPERPSEVEPKKVWFDNFPEPPDITEPKIAQYGEEDIFKRNQELYKATIESMRKRGIWYGAILPWLWVARKVIEGEPVSAAREAVVAGLTSVGTVAGLTKLADVLEKPAIRDWIAQPSAAQMKELERLPEDQRKGVAYSLAKIETLAKQKGYKVSPLITAYIAANLARPHVAVNDNNHHIGSHDGQNWFDMETGTAVGNWGTPP